MRRTSESSQYHDETPRRRVRRTPSHDFERHHSSDIKIARPLDVESIPTSPYSQSSFQYLGSHGVSTSPSPTRSVQPVSPHRSLNYPHHGFQRSFSQPVGTTGEMSPRSPFPHAVLSPSHYQTSSPMHISPAPSPTAPPCTPSCATPSSVTYTLSCGPGSVSPRGSGLKTPEFYPGIPDSSQLSPADSNFQHHYSSESFSNPREQQFVYSGGGPSPGGTIHHHGYNPPQRTPPLQSPTLFPNQPSPGRNQPAASSLNPHGGISMGRSHGVANRGDRSSGLPSNLSEIAKLRQLVIGCYNSELETLKANYREKLQEFYFLQTGGNMMDFLIWKKRTTPQFMTFLNSNRLDDTSGANPTLSTITGSPSSRFSQGFIWPQQGDGNNSTAVNYAALQRQVYEQAGLDPRKTVPGNFNTNPSYQSQISDGIAPNVSPFTGHQPVPRSSVVNTAPPLVRSVSLPNPPLELNIQPSQGNNHFEGDSAVLLPVQNNHVVSSGTVIHSGVQNQTIANGPTVAPLGARQPLNTRGQSLTSVLEHSFSSQEGIAVEAKKEAEVLKRVAELRKEGLWSLTRLPKVQETNRCKAHWDYLLEEMHWLATDFAQERRWKRGICKKISRAVLKYHQEQKSKEVKAEKEESVRLKKIAASIAKEIKQFWSSVEKVVQYKVQSRLEENRKKALDLQLNFIVDQTEKYSSWLAESLAVPPSSGPASAVSTGPSSPASSRAEGGDGEFELAEELDDEETIDAEEAQGETMSREKELEMLRQESEIPLEELLENLPPEILEDRSEQSGSEGSDDESSYDEESEASSKESDDSDIEVDIEGNDEDQVTKEWQKSAQERKAKVETMEADEEFVVTAGTEDDDEQTLDEEERMEEDTDHKNEIDNLQKEGEMPIEELMKMYAAAENESTDLQSDGESSQESSEEEISDEEGLEYLAQADQRNANESQSADSDPDQELTDAAATAQSLQPRGFTLETTDIKTKVPFLLRGTLREYQLIGLDWLVTMHEKHLNGILADEMGLGKTIQTISLLAHLACEKGVWGPHLVVVPTSVMLNWDLEFKKWCPGFKILTYYGSQKERKAKRQGWTKPNAFHVCITSYKLVIQDHQAFRRKKWKYFILDEAQNIKNFKSQRWQYLLNFNSHCRLLLTGTPLQNSLMELWSLMHFLMPHVFQSHKDFKEWFSNPLSGMIEGSREYNEGLIKRLHKVLRPFLLRRLKQEVETQMPKKYEHLVRCRLSKRQRYLYDDFMSKAKTKETLESGHFLSVINILMQLRKVCNHPDLFEPRPTVSPFHMEGIVFYTASLVLKAMDYNPLKQVNFGYLNLCISDIERTVTSYTAYRTQSLQTPSQMIVEIDSYPEPTRRLVPPVKLRRISMSGHPLTSYTGVRADVSNSVHQADQHMPSVPPPPYPAHPHHRIPTAYPPANLSHSVPHGLSPEVMGYPRPSYVGSATSRLQPAMPEGQHGYSTRHSAGSAGSFSASRLLMAGFGRAPPPPYPGHGAGFDAQRQPLPSHPSWSSPVVSSSTAESRTFVSGNANFPVSQSRPQAVQDSSTTSRLSYPETKSVSVSPNKRIALDNKSSLPAPSMSHVSKDSPFYLESLVDKRIALDSKVSLPAPCVSHVGKDSPFYLESLIEKRSKERKQKLKRIMEVNSRHAQAQPLYGLDLVKAVSIVNNLWHTAKLPECLTSVLKTPEDRISEMKEIITRFVFAVPTVEAPPIKLHTSHTPPSYLTNVQNLEEMFHCELTPKTTFMHPIARGFKMQFPEVRLIQYDCGKLQTLDLLLRKLKVEKHRVLIFTQMTKMLDVLESFLNYHGYIYLRLDGTTRVEQRQVLMERFNADSRIFCFILSTRSGGLGVNLTGADTVIFYDSDWNPTMDAQAQDRCHRIGQTRDVHIYRLISERTVEENILKKANQKRMLGNIAIEGGNFTTAYFKEGTLRDLFTIDPEATDSQTAAETTEAEDVPSDKQEMIETTNSADVSSNMAGGKVSQTLLEQALFKAEDEQDACAATRAKAEQAAELAEFDEGIPLSEDGSGKEEKSKVEEELSALENQMTPVERYAIRFLESSGAYITLEQIKAAKDEVEMAKKDWELGHLLALKKEEEKRVAEEEDEVLYTYSREDALQVYVNDITGEEMPIWTPPTPPREGQNEVYVDATVGYLYETTPMAAGRLPPLHLTKPHQAGKRTVYKSVVYFRDQLQGAAKDRVSRPTSVFDRNGFDPFARSRRNSLSKKSKMKQMKQQVTPSLVKQADYSQGAGIPEWLIHEDWALLQAVNSLQELPVDLAVNVPSQTPNWDIVCDIVNLTSRTFRSARQCRDRYSNMIIPREEGKIPLPGAEENVKKLRTKYKSSTQAFLTQSPYLPVKIKGPSGRSFKTHHLLAQDAGRSPTIVRSSVFELVKRTSQKRKPTLKQMLVDPQLKNFKHSSVLAASGISEEKTLNPVQLATMKAERIAREKAAASQNAVLQQQQQNQPQQNPPGSTPTQPQGSQIAQPQSASKQLTNSTTQLPAQKLTATTQLNATSVGTAAALQKTSALQGATGTTPSSNLLKTTAANIVLSGQSVPAGSAPSIVVNTHKGNAAGLSSMTSSHFAAINQRMQAKIPTSIVQVQANVSSAGISTSRILQTQPRQVSSALTSGSVTSITLGATTSQSAASSATAVSQIGQPVTTPSIATASHNTAQQYVGQQQGVKLTPQQFAMIKQRQMQAQLKRQQVEQQMKQQHLKRFQIGQVNQGAGAPSTATLAKPGAVQQASVQQRQQMVNHQQAAAAGAILQKKAPQTITQQQLQQILAKQQLGQLTPQQQVQLRQQLQQQQQQQLLQKMRQQQQQQQQQGVGSVTTMQSQPSGQLTSAPTSVTKPMTSQAQAQAQLLAAQKKQPQQQQVPGAVQVGGQVTAQPAVTPAQIPRQQQPQQMATVTLGQRTATPTVQLLQQQQQQQQQQVQQQQQQQQQHHHQSPYQMRLRNPPKH
ncbi:helicase domino-like isoform X1 [Montipora capricornis]|uniref:helicase domino-like isoform X1 n=1 Tax=Montipora capricornis TaxID=246305 RepID=UPI0035F205FF